MTLVDTNIIVDVLANNPMWMEWSVQQLESRSRAGPLIINDVIYAEVSIGFETEAELNRRLAVFEFVSERLPPSALFLAGKAYRHYKASGGARNNVLPDFFIGAHAQVGRLALLTRDLRRYRSYFPDVELITPGG